MIDPLLFEAVSALFHDAMRRRPPRLPRDMEELVEIALSQHEAFRAVCLDEPPIERLKEAAALLFHTLAALLERVDRSGDAAAEPVSTTLYGEMIRRLLPQTGDERDLGRRSARESLEPLRVMFRRVTDMREEEYGGPDSGREALRSCAEYLNGLAFLLYTLQHVPVVA